MFRLLQTRKKGHSVGRRTSVVLEGNGVQPGVDAQEQAGPEESTSSCLVERVHCLRGTASQGSSRT